jgi:hypothetical protein
MTTNKTPRARFTRHTVSAIIAARQESDLPDRVLEALRPFAGKMVTTRIVDKMPGGRDVWRLRRQYGMTHLENDVYLSSQGSDENGVSLLLAYTESSFPLDLQFVEDRNTAYFAARKHRNHRRMEARNDGEALDRMAEALNRIQDARAALEAALQDFGELTAYDSVFDPDRYAFERACGLRDENGNTKK